MYSKTIKKLVKKYTVHLIIIFFLANTSIALLIFSKAASNQCMTQTEIDSDSRCLYVYQNYVYEKGTKDKPHKGHACGMNVDSIMPNLHFVGNVLTKFNNTKIAPFCTGTNPTPTQSGQTATPTATATATATQQPTTPPTTTPTQQSTQQPVQATKTATSTPTQSGQAATQTAIATSTTTPVATSTQIGSGQVQTSVSYSGNTFGEILGKPKVEKVTPKLNLTKISKPVTYISLLSLIGSIILVILF